MTWYKTSNGRIEIGRENDVVLWKRLTPEGHELIFRITAHDASYLAEEVEHQIKDQSDCFKIDIPIVGSQQHLRFSVKASVTEVVEPLPGENVARYNIEHNTMINVVRKLSEHCQAVAPAHN